MWDKQILILMFTKSNLKGTYTWSAESGDNPKLKGNPDHSLLNRKEGYEVLYMVQRLMDIWKFSTIESGQKIESKIHSCPSDLHSQKNVQDWIQKNW